MQIKEGKRSMYVNEGQNTCHCIRESIGPLFLKEKREILLYGLYCHIKCRVIQEAKSLTSDQKKIGQLKQFV